MLNYLLSVVVKCVDSKILGLMSDDSNDSGVINNSNVTSENETDVSNHDHHGECCSNKTSRSSFVHPIFWCSLLFGPRMFVVSVVFLIHQLVPIQGVLGLCFFYACSVLTRV